MNFDRLTTTLLALSDDAPGLTQQQDARQDTHPARLAGLHQAGHLLAAGPLLDRTSPLRGLSILSPAPGEARTLQERDPAVQAGTLPDHRFAVDGASRSDDLLTHHLPTVYPRACRNLITVLGQTAQGLTQAAHRTKADSSPGTASPTRQNDRSGATLPRSRRTRPTRRSAATCAVPGKGHYTALEDERPRRPSAPKRRLPMMLGGAYTTKSQYGLGCSRSGRGLGTMLGAAVW